MVVHRAGTVILVRRSFAHNFTITDDILDPGYLQVIKFTPRTHVSQGRPFFSKTFSVTNAYIHSTCTKTKLGQLKLFGDYKDGCHHSFAGGDWNVKLLATDSANGKRSSGKVRKEFVDAFKRRRMTEVCCRACLGKPALAENQARHQGSARIRTTCCAS